MTSIISVLVNASPTKEFGMGRGLRQRDHLSSFLFLIVVGGFNMLMRNAVEEGQFTGFKFDTGEEQLTHLQYTNDTYIIDERMSSNIRIIKANMLLFEVSRI